MDEDGTNEHKEPRRGPVGDVLITVGKVALVVVLPVGIVAGWFIAAVVVFGTGEGTEENPDGSGLLKSRPGLLVVSLAIGVGLVVFMWVWLWREMGTRSRPVYNRLVVIALSLVPPWPIWGVLALVADLRRHPFGSELTVSQRVWPWSRPVVAGSRGA